MKNQLNADPDHVSRVKILLFDGVQSSVWTDVGIEESDAARIKTGSDKGLIQPHEGKEGGKANANVHLEMEGRRRGCGVMHYRVSGSHSLRVSDDITVLWRQEGGRGRRLM